MPEWVPEVNGEPMVTLRCQVCGGEVGLRTPGPEPDPELVVVRCFGCAATEEAEQITKEAANG